MNRAESVRELRDAGNLLVIACLFTLVGGYMDAYSYVAHNHVFATAQTGNVILFAVYSSGGQWEQAVRHLPPIFAFMLGVAAAKLLGVQQHKRTFRATLICQALEIAVLTALAVVGSGLPDAYVVPTISFVAAIQNTSFDKVGPWSFNSAMTTGNLREATIGLVQWLAGREAAENRVKAMALGLICLSFLAGAVCGGLFTRLDERYALVPCIGLVATGSLLTWRERRRATRLPVGLE